MIDPFTAFAAVKAGISAGKELHGMVKDLASFFDAIDGATEKHQNAQQKSFSSANEEALSTFMAKQQARDLENQLREIVMATRGYHAWQELVKIRVDIKRKRKEAEQKARLKKEEFWDSVLIWFLGIALALLVFSIGGLVLSAKMGWI